MKIYEAKGMKRLSMEEVKKTKKTADSWIVPIYDGGERD